MARSSWLRCSIVVVLLLCWLPPAALGDTTTADDADPPRDCNCEGGAAPEEEENSSLPIGVVVPAILCLVALSGLFSGLTLGLMGLDIIGLQIVQKGENKEMARCAAKIAPLREKGNQLLCTLLLGNTAVNAALSILTARVASGFVGFFVSTAMIVVFGEVLPQAACSRYALQVGARCVPLVTCIMYSPMYFITKPMSFALDWLLGQEVGIIHSRIELMEMLKLQINLGAMDRAEGEMAKQVAEGALSFRDKKVGDVMTPIEDAFMLHSESQLDYDIIRHIFENGYTRIPVYGADRNDYQGLLVTKDLMLADPEDGMKVGDFIRIFNRKVETFYASTKLVTALNYFKKGGTHMGLVRHVNTDIDTNPTFENLGVLTLEDIIEEILQDEIIDETDIYVDVDNHVRVEGRESNALNLEIFNPRWNRRDLTDQLSSEETAAVSAHLSRELFCAGGWELRIEAIRWLVRTSEVCSLTRATAAGVEEPVKQDWLYRYSEPTEFCTLVLQGRLCARVGLESFRSEVGAFSILAKHALMPDTFLPDFGAFVSTPTARVLKITRDQFQEAQRLNRNAKALSRELTKLDERANGELKRRSTPSEMLLGKSCFNVACLPTMF